MPPAAIRSRCGPGHPDSCTGKALVVIVARGENGVEQRHARTAQAVRRLPCPEADTNYLLGVGPTNRGSGEQRPTSAHTTHCAHAGEGEMTTIQRAFAEYFRNWSITLPNDVVQHHEPGEIRSHGWRIQYQFGIGEDGEFLDFYASHRMTNDRHVRLYESGHTEDLPAYHDMIVYPAGATADQERAAREAYERHNRDVARELKRKGFG